MDVHTSDCDADTFLRHIHGEIKRRQWDSVRDAYLIRELIHNTARHHRLPTSAADAAWLSFAPLGRLQQFIDDPAVEEVWVNADDRVFVSRQGLSELTSEVVSQEEIEGIVDRMLRGSHRRLDLQSPFVDVSLPDGSRLHAVISSVTGTAMALNIRKFPRRAMSLADLRSMGGVSSEQAAFLEKSVRDGASIVVSGATNSGKTTLARALLGALPAATRVITCEEVFELAPPGIDVVTMQTRPAGVEGAGEITLRKLIVESLRMRPDVLVVGEVRQAEAFDLLIALNSGVQGFCTVHANSADQALRKLTTLPLLAGGNVTSNFVVPAVAQSVSFVVHMLRDSRGRRRIEHIARVVGHEGDAILSEPVLLGKEAA